MVPGARATEVGVIVSDRRPLGFDFVRGMSAIRLLGGALLDREGHVQLNPLSMAACAGASGVMRIDDKDFVVTYDPTARSWTAAWKWANGSAPEVLQNAKMEYRPAAASRAAYEEELMSWIRNGWLIPYDERKFGPVQALIPLMAVVQRIKGKEEFEWLLTDDDQLDSEINSWVVLESEVQEIYTQVRKYPEDAGKKMELTKDAEAISNAGPLSNPFQPKWNLATFDGNVLKFAAFWDQLLEVKRKLWEEINSPSEDKTVSLESFLNFLQSQVEIEGVVPKTNKDKPVRPVKECLPAANLFSAPALVTKTNDPEASCDRTDTLW
ncbi:hypothetical protein D918_09693 [Trichuris suis]|nr:hypothetical protein D918_09693 [Trichuris suis]